MKQLLAHMIITILNTMKQNYKTCYTKSHITPVALKRLTQSNSGHTAESFRSLDVQTNNITTDKIKMVEGGICRRYLFRSSVLDIKKTRN